MFSVEGTAFDFRQPKLLATDINSQEEQIQVASGYDHSFINNQPISEPIAKAFSKETGIELQVFTNEPWHSFIQWQFLK
ncbi:Aldose 1-epimerase precursor [Sphingobacterium daejeonense]|nr:Aldose 1-epimerase precursor [Sphingobacterium daejeonense]